MLYIDGHCDVLLKMWDQGEALSFYDSDSGLDMNYGTMRQANYFMQTFAIFVPPEIRAGSRLSAALGMIDVFYRRVVKDESKVKPVLSEPDIADLHRNDQLGGLLLLEGAEAVEGNMHHLRILHQLGVRAVGLTWNWANEVADGVEEERGGGLTHFGRQFVDEMASLGMLLDVSHLSERGFWDVIEQSQHLSVYASHANARSICRHQRNLYDAQIETLIERDGVIGLTFVPRFLYDEYDEGRNYTNPEILLTHLDHVCSLGGVNHVAFGSDFDGFTHKIKNLSDARDIAYLTDLLLKHYKEDEVKGFLSENWLRFFKQSL